MSDAAAPITDRVPETAQSIEHVAIIGAGLAGCLLAALLAKRGIAVDLYERRPDPRLAGAERGRSINLAISARGLHALSQVGLDEQALRSALPMSGRTMHSRAAELSFQPYSADGKRAINSISRALLNESLLDCAEQARGVKLYFSHQLTAIDPDTGTMAFSTPDGDVTRAAGGIVASDGAYSATRRVLAERTGFTLQQDFLQHGYKELTIPGPERGIRDGSGLPAYLAARLVDDDRATQHRPVVHLHAVLAERRRVRFHRAADIRADHRLLRRALPGHARVDSEPGRRLPAQSCRLAADSALLAMGSGSGGAARRCRACDRPVLRAGRELLLRGLHRTRCLPDGDG